MNLTDLQQILKERIKAAPIELFGVEIAEPNTEIPPKPELGDVAFAVSFELAKLIKQQTGEKQAPRAIAEKLKTKLEDVELVDRVEIAGAGYINVFFNRPKLLTIFAKAARENKQRTATAAQPKKMVE